ncbi:hypothetical protein PM082_016840 [Marasmius tenuissimus]|nr:hypothetical protein PM082_016840 [Marasmius tenuissimus]
MAPRLPSTIRRYSRQQSKPSRLGLYYLPNGKPHSVKVPAGNPIPAVERFMNSWIRKDYLIARTMDQWTYGCSYTIWYFHQKNGNNSFPCNQYLEDHVGMSSGQ